MARSRRKSSAAAESKRPGSRQFVPEVLDRTVIAIPLLEWFDDPAKRGQSFQVVVDLNLNYQDGLRGARQVVEQRIAAIIAKRRQSAKALSFSVVDEDMEGEGVQYVFATLDAEAIKELARPDSGEPREKRAIHHIWPDFKLKTLINKSLSTVKADAAHNSFAAGGAGIVWAVIDSGIDKTHPHFEKYQNLDVALPLRHRDFTGGDAPLEDVKGHGTHVAGIIAGYFNAAERDGRRDGRKRSIVATTRYRDHNGEPAEAEVEPKLTEISGMAPECKLLSLKVLDGTGANSVGTVRGVIAALQYIQRLNGHGRRLLVHGVNLSVGYDFEPEWFACGQSPLCVEVDRLVHAGVVVVVAAGNSGFGVVTNQDGPSSAGLSLTINDPGNAEFAITVGSTHRDMPHTYGVSYFSSKGPTGDGRLKPDLVAPGEKVISCESSHTPEAVRRKKAAAGAREIVARYCEGSGTSQAAPHVSGVIAAFLSIRREFLHRPEDVKRIFMNTATDLNRERYFQGRGLVDIMRAIQSV
jgi:serine protease AprX